MEKYEYKSTIWCFLSYRLDMKQIKDKFFGYKYILLYLMNCLFIHANLVFLFMLFLL